MIHRLFGKIVHHDPEHLILRSGNMEWSIATNERCQQKLLNVASEEIALYTHLYFRQDVLILFGFSSILARHTFLSLISVNGVGPRHAQKILSYVEPTDIWKGIQHERLEAFAGVGGLGKKRIEKLFITLRDKIPILPEDRPSELPNQSLHDVTDGLVSMGYQRDAVQKAIRRLDAQEDTAALAENVIFQRLLELLEHEYS